MKCKQCGTTIVQTANVAYCPLCRVKRFRQPTEINPETGCWEGMYE